MQPVIYRSRRGRLSRGEREWRVEADALVMLGPSGHERRFAWKDVVSVRLCHEPARNRPWRYVFEIQAKGGLKSEIDNAHCAGGGAFEDRSSAYTPLVRAALACIAAANPKARALIGETQKRYFFLLLAALLALVAAAMALTLAPTPLDGLPSAPFLKLGLVLLMLPVFWRWVIGAMPRGVTLGEIPPRAFPPESA